ncbi:MAG: hypothetical protein NTU83_13825 [Candidatus Hydrogenedentes bacterium]|nr:hypothetical protein [Candidatus Hydrogenedentota bacterium]
MYSNPMAERRQVLENQLKSIKTIDVNFEKPPWDFDKWQGAIATKPAMWEALVAAPLPPPPPPKQPPDVPKMAEGISFGRQQIGAKIKMMDGKDPKGTFVKVSDKVNELTIKQITKTSVVLALPWEDQELTVEVPRK